VSRAGLQLCMQAPTDFCLAVGRARWWVLHASRCLQALLAGPPSSATVTHATFIAITRGSLKTHAQLPCISPCPWTWPLHLASYLRAMTLAGRGGCRCAAARHGHGTEPDYSACGPSLCTLPQPAASVRCPLQDVGAVTVLPLATGMAMMMTLLALKAARCAGLETPPPLHLHLHERRR